MYIEFRFIIRIHVHCLISLGKCSISITFPALTGLKGPAESAAAAGAVSDLHLVDSRILQLQSRRQTAQAEGTYTCRALAGRKARASKQCKKAVALHCV